MNKSKDKSVPLGIFIGASVPKLVVCFRGDNFMQQTAMDKPIVHV